jgi:hypothetical protein
MLKPYIYKPAQITKIPLKKSTYYHTTLEYTKKIIFIYNH